MAPISHLSPKVCHGIYRGGIVAPKKPTGAMESEEVVTWLGIKWRLTSVFGRVIASRNRVSLGKQVVFRGVPIITGGQLGKMIIGDRVQLVGDPRGTALGVRGPVILRLLAKDAAIEIGSDCGFSGTVICAAKAVRIGKRCLFGADVMVFDTDFHNHSVDNRRYSAPDWDLISKEVRIGDDVFIGTRSIIMKGVTIGSGSIIAAASVVTHDLPPHSVCGGVPAKVLGRISDQR
jgi:acetyltransferase-like isoleucine patch superfamily enzyme